MNATRSHVFGTPLAIDSMQRLSSATATNRMLLISSLYKKTLPQRELVDVNEITTKWLVQTVGSIANGSKPECDHRQGKAYQRTTIVHFVKNTGLRLSAIAFIVSAWILF
jgi:hypothetical protein